MNAFFPKTSVFLMIAATLITPCAFSASNVEDTLPDIGTTAAGTLTINQELLMGDGITRKIRASRPLINDPLLLRYINQLGMRLVKNADGVKTPFTFHLVNDPNINAYAYFGGNVVLHSSLFRYTQNESQLASVMAHEISHVTQRHLARMLEDQKFSGPLAIAGTIGSLLLMMASPQAGMAALTGTMAGARQGMISFTQANEQEADRIGLHTLRKSGFDPQAMADFMQVMADQSRYSSKLPEILYTHPLPDSRLADARNRASQYAKVNAPSSLDYLLARVRILTLYNNQGSDTVVQQIINTYRNGNEKEKLAAQYGQALLLSKNKQYAEATPIIHSLLTQNPNNLWFIDTLTDLDIDQQRAAQAANRLEGVINKSPNDPVIQINLANAYVHSEQFDKAARLLHKYTFNNPNDPNGWELIAEASARQGKRNEELAAYAESKLLVANYDSAIRDLTEASNLSVQGSHEQSRYNARIDAILQLKKRDKQLKI